jgi:hypothetical protein
MSQEQWKPSPIALLDDEPEICHIACCRAHHIALCSTDVTNAVDAPDDHEVDCVVCNDLYDNVPAFCPCGDGVCPWAAG